MTLTEGIQKIIQSDHHNPFEILGIHEVKTAKERYFVIRAYEPHAVKAYILKPEDPSFIAEMTPKYAPYFFEYKIKNTSEPFSYQIKVIYEDGNDRTYYDPYSFSPILSDFDLYLFGEGNHHKLYEKLGAHRTTKNGISGVYFACWAPNAKKVSLIGNFNHWDGRKHMMRTRGSSGVWELFIPELPVGTLYKYEIKTQSGHLYQKTDPFAFGAEVRPRSACVVTDLSNYTWNDQDWMEKRTHTDPLPLPLSVYEVHLGSWMRVPEEHNRFLTYRELAHKLADYVLDLGFTHIELMPITEHPFDGSWGYQVINYYAPTSRYGSPQEFMYFVDYMHQKGIGVIMDWVPAHFPKDAHGLAFYDGTHLFEHADPRLAEHKDWGTLIFNYGRNEVRNFLVANALFWLDKYHLDGLRVDAVASMLYLDYSKKEGEWIPNCYGGRENLEAIHFIKQTNEVAFHYFPNTLMIAEESTAWPGVSKPTYLGGLGFNFKWNMGWMNDFLSYISTDHIYRKYNQNLVTFSLIYAFHENFILSLSHDEVVHGKKSLIDKMPGNLEQKFANMRCLLAFMYGHPGKKLLFMGAEFGQWREWNHHASLDWHLLDHDPHKKLMACIRDLNRLYTSEPALYEEDYSWRGFEWINFSDTDNSVISFIRWDKAHKNHLIFICNFTPVIRENYQIGGHHLGQYNEILNTDSETYWGSNCGNTGTVTSEPHAWQDKPYTLSLRLPPLSTLVLKPAH